MHSTPRTTTVIYKADTEIRLTSTHSPMRVRGCLCGGAYPTRSCGCAGAYRPGKKKTARLRYSPNGSYKQACHLHCTRMHSERSGTPHSQHTTTVHSVSMLYKNYSGIFFLFMPCSCGLYTDRIQWYCGSVCMERAFCGHIALSMLEVWETVFGFPHFQCGERVPCRAHREPQGRARRERCAE